jgi:ribonuclease BN (tRNA processing enzyme)
MHLIFLGTAGFHPTERRHTSCVMLPEVGVVFDAGTGFFRVPEYLATPRLDVFLSHAHLDHVCGLPSFLVPMLEKRVEGVTVHGQPETLAAVREHVFAPAIFPADLGYEYRELTPEVPLGQGGVLRHARLRHPGGSTGYRVEWPGRSLAYVTDTTAGDDYLDLIRGVDLLIHECNFPDEFGQYAEPTGHSYTSAVADLARRADVGRLILTHFDPQRTDEDPIGLSTARAIFPPTDLAADGLEVEF